MRTLLSLALVFASSAAVAQDRLSLSAFVQDPARLAALKNGVRVMKARPPSDPTSWFFQAAMHGVQQAWVDQALARDPNVASVDQASYWNQCPHNGQPSADFLIWHRAYTHYFERILRDASGDATLSLPYWDYSKEPGFPAAFAEMDVDPVTGVIRNPLYDPRREFAFMAGLYDLSARAVSTTSAFTEKNFFGATETTGLAGGVADANSQTQGLMERRPHNSLHFALGGVIGLDPDDPNVASAGAMADVTTAAFDPIFWVHHANIDRLWSAWDCGAGRSWGTVPAKTWLEARPWTFIDNDGSLAKPSRLEILTDAAMYDRFEPAEANCTSRLSTTAPAPPPQPLLAMQLESFVAGRRAEVGRVQKRTVLSATGPVVEKVELKAPALFEKATVLKALEAAAPARARRVILELRGLDYDTPPSVGFDVYVNLPAGETPDPASTSFVGTLALFGIKHEHEGAHAAATQEFDITHLVKAPGFKPDSIQVSLVPFDLLEPRGEALPLRRSGGVGYESLAVHVVEDID